MSSQVWTCHDIYINLVQTFYWVFFFSPQVCLIIPLNFQSTWFIKEKKGNHYSSRLMLFSRLPVKDQHSIALPLCCFKYQLRFFVKLCQIFIPLEILTSASIGLTAIWICRLCVLKKSQSLTSIWSSRLCVLCVFSLSLKNHKFQC